MTFKSKATYYKVLIKLKKKIGQKMLSNFN